MIRKFVVSGFAPLKKKAQRVASVFPAGCANPLPVMPALMFDIRPDVFDLQFDVFDGNLLYFAFRSKSDAFEQNSVWTAQILANSNGNEVN